MQHLSASLSTFRTLSITALFRHAFQFMIRVYRTGKTVELCSFIGWEILYRIGYYKADRTVKFNSIPVFTLNGNGTPVATSPNKESQPESSLLIEPAPVDWKYCFEDAHATLWGCEYRADTWLVCSSDGHTAEPVFHFPASIRSLFVSQQAVFVCAGGVVYRAPIHDPRFEEVLRLTTPQSYFLFNNGCCELPNGSLLLGEYASIWQDNQWVNLAHLYCSSDEGLHWQRADFLKEQGVNKHIHLVKYAPSLQLTFLTDGDNKKQIWRNGSLLDHATTARRNQPGWHLINRFHWKMGGYTAMLDHGGGVVFGTDYLGGTNFLVHTANGRHFRPVVVPDPYRRSPVINMVARQTKKGMELWALLHNSIVPGNSCLLMYSTDNGESWTRFLEYDGQQHEIQLVSSSRGVSDRLYFCVREWVNGQENSQTYQIADRCPLT